MTVVYIYVEKGDLIGTGRGKPFREYVISYRKVRKSSDIGLGHTEYMSTGYKSSAVTIAKTLAREFLKDGLYSRLSVSNCGKGLDGKFTIDDKGKFWRVSR
jgi:hypothetical protein